MALVCFGPGGQGAGSGGPVGSCIGDVRFGGGSGAGKVLNPGVPDFGGGGGGAGGRTTSGNGGLSSVAGAAPAGGVGGPGGDGGTTAGTAGSIGQVAGGGGGGGGTTGSTNSVSGAGANGTVILDGISYTTPGSSSYDVPSGKTSVVAECWGAGSAGAPGLTTDGGGSGGGGGAYAKTTFAVVAGQRLYLTVGAGAPSRSAAGTQAAGGDSFVSTAPPFDFTSNDPQGWAFTAGAATGLTLAVVNDRLQLTRAGKSLSDGTPYLEWSGTWNEIGVPSDATVTAVNLGYDWRCLQYFTGASSTAGPAELCDSGGTVRNTFSVAQAFAATTSQATQAGANQTGLLEPASTPIRLRISLKPNTGSSNSASVQALIDNVTVAVTYSLPAPPSDPVSVSAGAFDHELNVKAWF